MRLGTSSAAVSYALDNIRTCDSISCILTADCVYASTCFDVTSSYSHIGPLTTSYTVKESTLRDLGSRDVEFMRIITDINDMLLELAAVSKEEYTVIPVQGSGTYGVESVLCTAVHRRNGVLILSNGAYGQRMVSNDACCIDAETCRVNATLCAHTCSNSLTVTSIHVLCELAAVSSTSGC